MEYVLKRILPSGVEAALHKADRYRELNQPAEAESICRDVLAVDADSQLALRTLGLALTDQFEPSSGARFAEAARVFAQLHDPYERAFYAGLACERLLLQALRTGDGRVGNRQPVDAAFQRRRHDGVQRLERHVGRDLQDDRGLPPPLVGDIACLAGPGGKPLPGLATVAIQQAHHVAKGIHAGEAGASTPFKYLDKGALAVVGRGKAVCEIRGLRYSGRPAFLTYAGVHLFYLGGQLGRRVEVMVKWVGARFGERQSALIEGELASVERASRAAEATQWARTSSR